MICEDYMLISYQFAVAFSLNGLEVHVCSSCGKHL